MKGIGFIAALLAAACAGGLGVWLAIERRPPATVTRGQAEAREAAGKLSISPEAQKRAGIQTEALSARVLKPQLIAYGRLEEDLSRSFTVRAPQAGVLQTSKERGWPVVGQALHDSEIFGAIEPRLAATDKVALTGQLAAARSELRSSDAALVAARQAFERARILNADGKNVSDRVVQEAQARLAAEEARAKAARDAIELLEASLRSAGPGGRAPLAAARGGDVVEVMAQPGENIESGQAITRLARFDQLLARVTAPVGQHVPASAATARIVAVGFEDRPARGERVALSAAVDPRMQGEVLLFRVAGGPREWRPGLAVTAYLDLAGRGRAGVVVPRAAVVRRGSSAYVYVQTGAAEFQRREIALDDPVDLGYFTMELTPKDRVVTAGAQILLSEENKSEMQLEVEGS